MVHRHEPIRDITSLSNLVMALRVGVGVGVGLLTTMGADTPSTEKPASASTALRFSSVTDAAIESTSVLGTVATMSTTMLGLSSRRRRRWLCVTDLMAVLDISTPSASATPCKNASRTEL